MTNQRVKILEYLKSTNTHPTAEKVHEKVEKELPKITLATVYRNLNKLAKKGKILRLEVNGVYRYDADTGPHQHCVCRKCGKIMDVFQPEISEKAIEKLETKKFNPDSVVVIYKGFCRECEE